MSEQIAHDAEHWITLENGQHALIDGDGTVLAGAGGNLIGEKIPSRNKDISKSSEASSRTVPATRKFAKGEDPHSMGIKAALSGRTNSDHPYAKGSSDERAFMHGHNIGSRANKSQGPVLGESESHLSEVTNKAYYTPEQRLAREREDLLVQSIRDPAKKKDLEDFDARQDEIWHKKMDIHNAMDSARSADINGYVTIKRNPISRSGIFQYSGAQIGLDAEPGKIYNVYRPAEEWQDPEALESVKHVPWIDDHVMLGGIGSEHTSPDQKGVHGITCDDVSFENGTVYANLKIFSKTLADLVARGKRELSLGFRCAFEKSAGVFDGQKFSYIQRHLRANHLALVDRGRAGPNIAVLDHTTAFDHFDLALDTEEGIEMAEEVKHPTVDLTELASIIKSSVEAAVAPITARVDSLSEKMAADAAERDAKEKADAEAKAKAEEDEAKEKAEKEAAAAKAAEDEKAEVKTTAEVEAAAKAEAEKKAAELAAMDGKVSKALKDIAAMDAKLEEATKATYRSIQQEAAAKTSLATSLFPFTGVFDHSDMASAAEVAAYGVEKLKIPAEKGTEVTALKAYLHNRPAPSASEALALDNAANNNAADAKVKAFFSANK